MSTARRSVVEALEPRRLMTFVLPDAGFGDNGIEVLGPGAGGPALTALADERVAAFNGSSVELRLADGSGDPRHRRVRVADFDEWTDARVAVDPATGRVAVYGVTGRDGVDDTPDALRLRVDLYAPNGRLERSTPDAVPGLFGPARAVAGFENATVHFAPDGGLVVDASRQSTRPGYNPEYDVETEPVLVRLRPDGTPVAGFATERGGGPIRGDRFDLVGFDAAGRAYLVETNDNDSGSSSTTSGSIVRLLADGRVDAAYGTNGSAPLYYDGDTAGYHDFVRLGDVAVAADGRVTALVERTGQADYRREQVTTTALRLRPDGAVRRDRVLSSNAGDAVNVGGTLQLALAPDGSAYVAGGDNGHTRLWHLLGDDDLTVDPAWSTFGPFAELPIGFEASDLAVDAAGRPVLSGRATSNATVTTVDEFGGRRTTGAESALLRVAGSAEGFGTGPATTRLLPGGLLEVSGTGRADRVSVNLRSGRVGVSINGGRRVRYDAAAVRGVLVHTGGGDDKVVVGANVAGVYVQAGRGDDSVYGTSGPDTLVGGDGRDRLYAGDGDDHVYGQGGDDLIVGGGGADELFGGDGRDRVYAFTSKAFDDDTDGDDTLSGGRAADLIAGSAWTYYRNFGDLLLTDDADTILG